MSIQVSGEPHLHFASAVCSRRAGALSVLPSKTLAAYASANNALLLKAGSHEVYAVLPLRDAAVTAVHLTATRNEQVLLFAAAADGKRAVASIREHHVVDVTKWVAHEEQPCAAIHACDVDGMAVITAGMDGELRLWRQGADFGPWKLVAKADVAPPGAVLLECVALQRTAGKTAVVAVRKDESMRLALFRLARRRSMSTEGSSTRWAS